MKPRIAVIGVGGAGGNAVNNMIAAGLSGPEFIVANTDAQALETSAAEKRIQLGRTVTEGLGAGSKPEIGEAAAEESLEDIRAAIAGCHMVFIAAGMGGGTGTGAASVIARVAKDFGILTIAVVTKPFQFEGSRRLKVAEIGIAELRSHVDTLLIIPNQNLFNIATERTTFAEAFLKADRVLYSGIACIVDLIVKEGHINLDLADVKTVLSGMGPAMMGTGEASGEQRAIVAAEEAIVNPLLDEVSLKGAKSLLLSITGGRDLTLWEVDEAANTVRKEVDPDANIIVGATFDETLGDRVRVSIVASGMARMPPPLPRGNESPAWTPRSQHPPVQKVAAEDYRRRLSAAMDEAAVTPSQVPDEDAVWRGPGDVRIKEGPPQLSGLSSARGRDPARTGEHYPASDRRAVAPSDLPPAGQREYWAKSVASDPQARAPEPTSGYQRQPESPTRKVGLLRRLTGAGRGSDEEIRASDQLPKHHDRKGGAARGGEPVDRPVFFGRNKR